MVAVEVCATLALGEDHLVYHLVQTQQGRANDHDDITHYAAPAEAF
jgi:hypothetical protein